MIITVKYHGGASTTIARVKSFSIVGCMLYIAFESGGYTAVDFTFATIEVTQS